MPLPKELKYERQFFVKDLLSADSLIKNSSTLEYDTFIDFVDTFLRNRFYSLDTVEKIIVPVDNTDEARFLLSINPNARPFLIIYLRDFSKATRDEFKEIENTAILCAAKDIPLLKQAITEEPSLNFISFLSKTYGYFRDYITIDDIDNILYKYSNPYLAFPFFSIADIRWDWKSFEELPLKDLHGIVYHCNFIFNNIIRQPRSLDWSTFGLNKYSSFKFDYMRVNNIKRPFIREGKLYIDYNCLGDYVYDFNKYKDLDTNNIPLVDVDYIRSPFDTKITPNSGLSDITLDSIGQNILCNGNPAMVPYLCTIVTKLLRGERL